MSVAIRRTLLLPLVLALVATGCGTGDSSTVDEPTATAAKAVSTTTNAEPAPNTSTTRLTTTTTTPLTTTTTVVISLAMQVLVETVINENGTRGTFSATNAAGVCPSEELDNIDFEFTETIWWFFDEYTCADGSGSWVIRGEIPLDPDVDESTFSTFEGTWWVLRGTDQYARLEGSGTYRSSLEPVWTEMYFGEFTPG